MRQSISHLTCIFTSGDNDMTEIWQRVIFPGYTKLTNFSINQIEQPILIQDNTPLRIIARHLT